MSADAEVDYDEMVDAFVLCWTEVEEHGHRGMKATVGPYEIIVRRAASAAAAPSPAPDAAEHGTDVDGE